MFFQSTRTAPALEWGVFGIPRGSTTGPMGPSSCRHILRECPSFLPATGQQQSPLVPLTELNLTFVNFLDVGGGREREASLFMDGGKNQNFWHFVNIVGVSFMYTFFFQYFQKPFYITESQPKPNPLNLAGFSLGLVSVMFTLCHIWNCSISQV